MAIKIFIDQGHGPGGVNGGAEANGLVEQDVTYNVGRYLANLLASDGRFEVMTSRNSPDEIIGTDTLSSLRERVRMANDWGANYFISLHTNANDNPAINGSEVYVYSMWSEAYNMAEYILNSIVANVGTNYNGVRVNPSLYVLRYTRMPAMLVELGYLTNTSDAQKLRDNQYGFAYAIYLGLLEYFGLELN